MFGIGHVHVADDVHDAAVGLFGQAFVLAAVAPRTIRTARNQF